MHLLARPGTTAGSAASGEPRDTALHIDPKDIDIMLNEHDEKVVLGKGGYGEVRVCAWWLVCMTAQEIA